MRYAVLFFSLVVLMVSCGKQKPKPNREAREFSADVDTVAADTVTEVGRSVRYIMEDSKNNFWFATDGQGVYKYDGKTLIQYRDKQGLCSNYVWHIVEGRDGKMWFKTRDAVCSYNGLVFSTQKPVLPAKAVPFDPKRHDLILDHYFDGKNLMKIQLPETSSLKKTSEHHYDIYATLKDSKGNIWFGTCTAGVCVFNGKTYTWLDDPALGVPVRTIYEDSKGNIWIGNNGYGLFRYDGKSLRNLTKEHRLDHPDFLKTMETKEGTMARVWSVAEDADGKVWIATIDTNIWLYDGKSILNFTNKGRIGTDAIWTIYKDRKGRMWFGTDGASVYVLEGKSFLKMKALPKLKP